METGLANMSRTGHARFCGRGFAHALAIGVVLVSGIDSALADGSSRTAIETPQPPSESDSGLPQLSATHLNLILTGVAKGQDIALIRVAGGREEPFAVGEAIASGVKLLAVGSFSAVISREGTPERLELSRRAAASSAPVSDLPVPASQGPVAAQPRLFKSGLMVAFTPPEVVQDLGNSRFSVKRSYINDQLRLGRLFDNARVERDTGGGFRVTDIVPGSVYDTLGLKDGDTISAINGKPPQSMAELMNLYEQRDSIKTVQIQVMRGGSLSDFRLDFH